MFHRSLRLVAACVLAAAGMPLFAAGPAELVPPSERITDEAIRADQATYRRMQDRIQGVNDRGRPLRDYHLSKAQCWLDVSFHEYTRNDRSAFPQDALREADRLVARLEAAPGVAPLDGPWDTPRVNGAALLRPDLWARAEALRGHAGFAACAAQRTACAEVELVHAGNEFNQQQWRHAKPYVQIAEDQLGEAEQAAAACGPAPAVSAAPAPVARGVALNANVLFNFDRHERDQIRASSLDSVKALAERIARGDVRVTSVQLAGHADRLNQTGDARYNETLADRRVKTVRDLLVEFGVPAGVITVAEYGDTRQVASCDRERLSRTELQECLLPNRRVEVVVLGQDGPAR